MIEHVVHDINHAPHRTTGGPKTGTLFCMPKLHTP